MTDKLRAAAEAALEALERSRAYVYETDRQQVDGAMDGLRAALAEPTCKDDLQDAEPYLLYDDDTGDTWMPEAVAEGWALTDLRPLYVSPVRREWQGLTDEERKQFVQWMHPDVLERVEAALKEKNA